jgi:hypothetical protein
MVQADDIRELRQVAFDYQETEHLKQDLRNLRLERDPFYLAKNDLDSIFRWKLRNQYGRCRRRLDANTPSACRVVTQAAFAVRELDEDYEADLRLGILKALWGVGVPVASAILALVEPDRYCVIDFRGWRVVTGERRDEFGINQYLQYRSAVRQLAHQLGWSLQETDLAIWEYDRRLGAREV